MSRKTDPTTGGPGIGVLLVSVRTPGSPHRPRRCPSLQGQYWKSAETEETEKSGGTCTGAAEIGTLGTSKRQRGWVAWVAADAAE